MVDSNSRRSGRDEAPRRSGRDDSPPSRSSSSRDDDRGSRSRDDGHSSRREGSSSGFTYQGRDRAQVEKRSSMGANDFDKILKDYVKTWTPKQGNNRVRIVPPTWTKPGHYGYDIYVHYGVGADRGSYLDLDKMLGKPDPITEERNNLKRDGGATEDEIKKMDSKRRVLCYIIDRDDEAEGVQAWAMPWTLDKDITVLSVDRTTGEVINIDDPEDGYDVEFKREGEKDRTKYVGVAIARRPSRLGKSEWLDYAIDNPLPDQLQYFTYEEIAKTFGGGGAIRERDNSSDQGEDRGSRSDRVDRDDRDRGRDEGRRPSADRGVVGRGDTERSSRDDDRGRVEEPPTLTWVSIHEMTASELDALCEGNSKLSKINPDDAKDDSELADWICEDLDIKNEPAPSSRRRVAAQESPEREAEYEEAAKASDKLAEMRNRRERR